MKFSSTDFNSACYMVNGVWLGRTFKNNRYYFDDIGSESFTDEMNILDEMTGGNNE